MYKSKRNNLHDDMWDIYLKKITERKLSEYQERCNYYATCIYRGRRDCQQNAKERTIKTRCLLEELPQCSLFLSVFQSLSYAVHRSSKVYGVHQTLHYRRVT